MPIYRITDDSTGKTIRIDSPAALSAEEQAGIASQAFTTGSESVQIGAQTPPATSQIRAEPSFLRQALREVPPLAGLIAGGLAGAPLGPAGAVSGAGLGHAGGRQFTRAVEATEEAISPPPPGTPPTFRQPFSTQAKNIGQDVLAGSLMELLPAPLLRALQGAGRLGGRLIGVGVPTAEDLAIRAAASRQGLEMTAGAKSGSPAVSLLESIPGRFPIGRQTAEPTFTRVRESGRQVAERLGQQLGPEVSLETAGKTIQSEIGVISQAQENAPTVLVDDFIDSLGGGRLQGKLPLGKSLQEGLKVTQKARRATATTLYNEALDLGRREAEVSLTSLQDVSSKMAAFEQRLRGVESRVAGRAAKLRETSSAEPFRAEDLPSESIRALLRTNPDLAALLQQGKRISPQSLPQEFIEEFGLSTVGTRTLEETLSIQQRLKSHIRNNSDDFTRGQFRELADAVTADIVAFGRTAGGEFGRKLDIASQFYKREVAELFAERSFLRKLLNAAPGQAATKVLNTKSPDELIALMRGLPRRQRKETQRMVLETIKGSSLELKTGEVSPIKLEDTLNRFGEENLSILLGPRARDLAALRKTLSTGFGRGTQEPVLDQILTGSPENLVNSLARGKIKSLDDFDAVWGSLSGQGQSKTRNSLYGEVLENSTDPATGLFSQDRFIRQKELVPQAIWDRMMSTDFTGALRDIEMVFRRNIALSRSAANPSQTAMGLLGPSQVLGGMALAGSTAFGREDPESFALKALALLSPSILGKAIFSKAGQRLLTSQPPAQINPQGSLSTLGKILGTSLAPEDRP